MPSRLSRSIQIEIRDRAKYLCEYCHTDETWQYVTFTIDHIVPVSEGGEDGLDNLALACFYCNRRKSSNVAIYDEESSEIVPIFHPRKQKWSDHFVWSKDGLSIRSLTSVGRVTIALLDMNRERILQIRAADLAVGRHPPLEDPVDSSE